MMMAGCEFAQRSEHIEELVQRLETMGDVSTRAVVSELLRSVVVLHGMAIERILDEIVDMPEADSALDAMAKDELVSGVLLLHNLHPIRLEHRVQSALDRVRPYVQSHGGDVELPSVGDGVVSVQLHGAWDSGAVSAETMKRAVEEAIYNAAPEVSAVLIEHVPPPACSHLVMLRAS